MSYTRVSLNIFFPFIFLLRLKYWDKESAEAIRETEAKAAPRGELDFLNMEQLINIRDLESSHGPKRKF